MNINSFIDHTLLKPTAILQEVDTICAEAVEYGFASVCIPPIYVERAAAKVKGSKVKVTTVIGFPFGYTYMETKVEETKQALGNGANEIDMVMNIAALKNGDLEYLKKEVSAVLPTVVDIREIEMFAQMSDGKYLNNDELSRITELYNNSFFV